MPAAPKPQLLLDMRGRPLIERRGVRRASIAYDAYHFLRTSSWSRLLGMFAFVFLASNFVFACAYWISGAKVLNADGFHDLYWFSVQSMATIGYGFLAPGNDIANALVTIEAFFSLIMTAIVTGIFFARFSTPKARVVFSKSALVGIHDGQRVLMFRMANERATAIVEATIRAYLVRDEKLANGEPWRRVYDLALKRNSSPVFALSFLAYHVIDDASPLKDISPEALRASNVNLIITFTGIDDSLASTVHARYMWTPDEIVFDHRFADLIRTDDGGKRYLDLGPIHDIEPVLAAASASGRPD